MAQTDPSTSQAQSPLIFSAHSDIVVPVNYIVSMMYFKFCNDDNDNNHLYSAHKPKRRK